MNLKGNMKSSIVYFLKKYINYLIVIRINCSLYSILKYVFNIFSWKLTVIYNYFKKLEIFLNIERTINGYNLFTFFFR